MHIMKIQLLFDENVINGGEGTLPPPHELRVRENVYYSIKEMEVSMLKCWSFFFKNQLSNHASSGGLERVVCKKQGTHKE